VVSQANYLDISLPFLPYPPTPYMFCISSYRTNVSKSLSLLPLFSYLLPFFPRLFSSSFHPSLGLRGLLFPSISHSLQVLSPLPFTPHQLLLNACYPTLHPLMLTQQFPNKIKFTWCIHQVNSSKLH